HEGCLDTSLVRASRRCSLLYLRLDIESRSPSSWPEVTKVEYEEGPGENGAAGAHFFLSLGEEELAGCEYHRRDWISIAAASVELLERLDPKCSYEEVLAAASELLPPGGDREELCFLFSDPINWSPGESRLTNGQHRTCALKAAGAPLCAVSTNRRWAIGKPEAGDPRRMAQSALASYWARRLGQS
ncbi:MAG: hypothetical protein ACM3N0_04145, partial [Chloroflexota bacterium]